jgi:hypothetical protein
VVAIQRGQSLLHCLSGLNKAAQVVVGRVIVQTNRFDSLALLEHANPTYGTFEARDFIIAKQRFLFSRLCGIFLCPLGLGF